MSNNTFMPATESTENAGRKPCLLEMQELPSPEGFEEAAGPLLYKMTNDAMFHIVFEACPEALKAFTGALLHLHPSEIISIEVTNPIVYDFSIYSKTFVLNLKILLNGSSVLNIELQMESLSFWKERSLAYLCRAFDNLNRGGQYLNIKPAIHVGILDFHIFPDDTSFYSTYYLLNELTHKKYSDNLQLSVLQLKQAANATEEDKAWHLDLWARFFKTQTWEGIHMIAERDSCITKAAQTLYRASADERIRSLCEGREEGEKTQRTIRLIHQMELQQKDNEIARLRAELKALKQQEK
ncbi:MAG: Rpn family recombination-promoting nuclease/putative transposase [Lachnospiraceae bacterium]|nr:Rpn family recombination-promoting nuclease/putative transposase [Lachnospiraceae bacterium]